VLPAKLEGGLEVDENPNEWMSGDNEETSIQRDWRVGWHSWASVHEKRPSYSNNPGQEASIRDNPRQFSMNE
jgi:hypothetical protein